MAELSPNFINSVPFSRPRPTEVNAHIRLYGVGEPRGSETRLTEKPWHKMAATMFATGRVTISQVAASCDVSKESVSDLLRNPWFQETVTQLMRDQNGPSVLDLFDAEQINSLLTLVEIRDDTKVSANTRRQSAIDILDRSKVGKPVQRIETDNIHRSQDPAQEAQQLADQIASRKVKLIESGVLVDMKDFELSPEDQLSEQRSCDRVVKEDSNSQQPQAESREPAGASGQLPLTESNSNESAN